MTGTASSKGPLYGGVARGIPRFRAERSVHLVREISPSGKGLRVFVQGTLPPGNRKHGTVEVYESARFLTVTGHHVENTEKETSSSIHGRY